jgi:hypothetical protein
MLERIWLEVLAAESGVACYALEGQVWEGQRVLLSARVGVTLDIRQLAVRVTIL